MKRNTKMPAEERRAAIIRAVRRVFAEKGFHGTTTRALAEAAGVSEALLFKHFPDKEALFSAMQLSCCTEQDHERVERLTALPPSASTLVLMVHFLFSRFVGGCASRDDEQMIQSRLMLRSLAEDGEFARLLLRRAASGWVAKIRECLEAAMLAGEAVEGPVLPELGSWFVHHLPALIKINLLPEPPAVDYGVSTDRLIEQGVWFALRGLGLKEEAIRRYYNPEALKLFAR
jgi:AcrR family transcriptional regulator